MAQDIEMKSADEGAKTQSEGAGKEERKVVVQSVAAHIKSNLALLHRAVHALEPRITARVLRSLTALRRQLDREALTEALRAGYQPCSQRNALEAALQHVRTREEVRAAQAQAGGAGGAGEGMEVDTHEDKGKSEESASKDTPAGAAEATPAPAAAPAASAAAGKDDKSPAQDITHEGDMYLRILIIMAIIDAGNARHAYNLALNSSKTIQSLNRRSMDHIAAKMYFYLVRAAELRGGTWAADLRPTLLAAHSTAALRHDEDLQGTLINLLLRSYFQANLYDQADKLLSKTTFPESCGNAQLARYLFYLGRIRAVQLNYTEAHAHLQHAIRRAPPATTAPGFVQTAHKFFVVVELLMGDIPERSTFRQPVLRKALAPYFQIVQAVRVGDLDAFSKALTAYTPRFLADGTHSLILRLRHNVIKTALRMISIAYSRISLRDICLKLHLDSEEDTEYIVAKAIRDGVIDAELDHAGGWMKSREAGNVYETDEPQKAFQQRIDFCINLHNESVKAMRYPLNAHRADDKEDSELVRERMLDIESALNEAEEDDDMMDGF